MEFGLRERTLKRPMGADCRQRTLNDGFRLAISGLRRVRGCWYADAAGRQAEWGPRPEDHSRRSPINRRRPPDDVAELAGEVSLIGEPQLCGEVLGLTPIHPLGNPLEPSASDGPERGYPDEAPKGALERTRTHMDRGSQVIHTHEVALVDKLAGRPYHMEG